MTLPQRLSEEAGSSLIELLVTIPAALAVGAAAFAVSGVFAREERTTASRTSVIEAQRIATERITRDIRQASAATVLDGGAGLQLATYVFRDRVRTAATVTYDCSTATCLRTVAPDPTATAVISGVRNPTTVFSMPTSNTVFVELRVDVPNQASDATVADGAQLVNR